MRFDNFTNCEKKNDMNNTPNGISEIQHSLESRIGRDLTNQESDDLSDYLTDQDTGEFLTPLNDLRYLQEVMGY